MMQWSHTHTTTGLIKLGYTTKLVYTEYHNKQYVYLTHMYTAHAHTHTHTHTNTHTHTHTHTDSPVYSSEEVCLSLQLYHTDLCACTVREEECGNNGGNGWRRGYISNH